MDSDQVAANAIDDRLEDGDSRELGDSEVEDAATDGRDGHGRDDRRPASVQDFPCEPVLVSNHGPDRDKREEDEDEGGADPDGRVDGVVEEGGYVG